MLIEWLFERKNPGPTGDLNGERYRPEWPRFWIILLGMLALLLLAWFIKDVIIDEKESLDTIAIHLVLLALYLCASYFIYPQPRYDNLGWGGGLIGNPFRFTDDINRMLVFLKVILLPGKLITVPIAALYKLLYNEYRERNRIR